MAHNSTEFHAKCSALRAAARKLLKDQATSTHELPCQLQADGTTINATPGTLRMSMGEVRKKKPATLCTFARSELMVRARFDF